MRIEYYSNTDSLCIYVSEGVSAETDVIGEGIQADFDREGSLIGFEIEHVEFDASPVTLRTALMNLRKNVTAEERRQISLAFDQILAGKHKQLDIIF